MSDVPGAKHLTREEQRRIEARVSVNDVPLMDTPTPPSPEPPREREGEPDLRDPAVMILRYGSTVGIRECAVCRAPYPEWSVVSGLLCPACRCAASLPPSAGTREPEDDREVREMIEGAIRFASYPMDGWEYTAGQRDRMLEWLAAHPAGPTRAEEGKPPRLLGSRMVLWHHPECRVEETGECRLECGYHTPATPTTEEP